MKKHIFIFSLLLILCIISGALSYADENPSSNMEGPEILRTHDSLTVVYSVDNIRCSGFQGTISYNKDKMLLSDAYTHSNSWNVEVNHSGMFLAYSKTPSNPELDFTGGELFTLVFTLKNDTEAGDTVDITVTDVIGATIDGQENSEIKIPDVSYKKTIDPPASEDASLSSLGISDVIISPAFSPDITEYTVQFGVAYSTTALELSLSLSHEKSSYEIIGNELKVGNNKITVRVTAENGNVKDYFIFVKRAHDPAEPLFSDSRISSIEISAGTLSPAFSPDIKNYIVWLPFELAEFTVSATPFNEFSSEIQPQNISLKDGKNEVKVTCVAEDNSSSEYTITVYVMPKFEGFVPNIVNKIPLIGTPAIDGVLNIGVPLRAYLKDAPEGSYLVEWFCRGEKVSEGEIYTPTEVDVNSVIYAKISAVGNYSGVFYTDRYTVLESGELVATDTFVPQEETSADYGTAFIIVLICAALFFTLGIILGSFKKRQKVQDKEN